MKTRQPTAPYASRCNFGRQPNEILHSTRRTPNTFQSIQVMWIMGFALRRREPAATRAR